MTISLLRPTVLAPIRRQVLRWTMGRRGGLDVTMVTKLPESTTYALRRNGIDPVPELARARETNPVTRLIRAFGMNVWLVSGHDEGRAVLADSSSFSNDLRHLLGNRDRSDAEGIGGLGMTDPPDHTRLRGLLTPEFTKRRLARLVDQIDTIVAETLDDLESAGPEADLVPDFGFAIPFRVICELLGLSVEDRHAFHQLGAARFDLGQGGFGVFNAATESREFLIDAVARQRSDPGPGLIGALLRDHGDEFDDVELGGLADGVFLGGYETSASMLAMGTYVLSQHPETYAALPTAGPAEMDAVIEELLRLLCPVQIAFPRFARQDMDLFGARVSKGDLIAVSLAGANRDPRKYDEAEEFCPARFHTGAGAGSAAVHDKADEGGDPAPDDGQSVVGRSGMVGQRRQVPGSGRAHLAFGHGLHRCVGSELAKMEMRAALRGLAARFPGLRLAVPAEELCFRELSAVHGIDALPVRLW